MEAIVFVLFYLVLFFWDTFPLIKAKQKKAFWISLILIVFSLVIREMYVFYVDIPSPAPFIQQFFTSLLNL